MESSRSYFQKNTKNGKKHADAFKGQAEKLGKEEHQKNMVESQGCLYPFAFATATQIISVTMLQVVKKVKTYAPSSYER